MKKILILAVVAVLALTANAHDFEVDGIYYNINGNEVSVSYRGQYYDSYDNEYSGSITIPPTVTYDGFTYKVTSIGYCAFDQCFSLTSIELPNTIISIDHYAFCDCHGLSSIEIPNTVTSLGMEAFERCSSLTSIRIPFSVTSINDDVFSGCDNLMSIEFPNTFIYYGNGVFDGTVWYNNQPDGVVYAGKIAYKYKGTMPTGTTITLEEGTLGIAIWAFAGCNGLANIIIPNSVISIGYESFSGCSGLTNVVIPNSAMSIGDGAFQNCTGLTSVDIPNSVTTINAGVFSGCTSLKSINFPNSLNSIGGRAFYGCTGLRNTDIILPESVRSIGRAAFKDTYISQISFEGEIDYLGESAFDNYGNAGTLQLLAFYGNINNGIGNQAFSHYYASTSHDQRHIKQLFFGGKVDSIKGLNIKPGDEIFSYNPVPPVADENTFLSYGSTTVHVPATSLAAYFTAPYWSNFANIVGDAVTLEEVTIDKDSVEVNLGTQFNLIATISPSNATTSDITWRTTNNKVATVNNGLVSAIGVGECHIIAQCLNKKAICHVVVNDTTVTITLDQQEAMVLPNHIITFTPSASPVMPDLVVSSSDPTVAATRLVNGKVQVVGIKEGTTTITVGSADGTAVPATCIVTVYTELGDMNMDGFVNISDVTQMIDYLLGSEVSIFKEANADLNGDDSVTIGDVTALIDMLLSSGN